MADTAGSDFGGRMRRLREERGVALRDIAETTKISVVALEALERNDISRLPGGIFSRAIVRSYAEEIGVDPERTLREFIDRFPLETVVVGIPHVYQTDFEEPEDRRSRHLRLTIGLAIAIPVIAILIWSYLALR